MIAHTIMHHSKAYISGTIVSVFILLMITSTTALSQLDIQGHRGCRGMLPENTIPAFIRAINLEVTTLELDVVITANGDVLLSHEPFMSHEICLMPDGSRISESNEKELNIYQMTTERAQSFSCGEIPHPQFREQQNMKVYKPLLSEVIDSVESYLKFNNLPLVHYNIETKCTLQGDNIFHPGPEAFADTVMSVIQSRGITDRCYIQSFDVRTLQHLKAINAPVKLVLLVENTGGIRKNLKNLGFIPEVYSPYYMLLTNKNVQSLQKKGMKVIPWTVNDEKAMKSLIAMGVDGLITDYPDKLQKMLRRK